MNERLAKIFKHPVTVPIVVGGVALGVGLVAGYFIGKRNETVEDEDATNEQESEMPFTDIDFGVDPDEVKDAFKKEMVRIEKGIRQRATQIEQIQPEEGPVEELVKKTVFPPTDDVWDYEEELKNRSPEKPFVIHKDEFYAEELEYQQSTLTYYAGDDIMVDQEDAPMYNHAQITGPLLFGHGSGDPNVVHIRNMKRKVEFEVLFDPGMYSLEVLGIEIENNERVRDLKHSSPGLKKFRLE